MHKPTNETRSQVFALVSFGVVQERVARFLGISDDTLRKWYAEELETAAIKRNSEVGEFLFHTASGNAIKDGASHAECVRAAMFWAKTRMGWRETNTLDLTSSDGTMTPTKIVIEAAQVGTDSDN